MKLHKPAGKNRWCGPNAGSIITGIPSHQVAGDIRMMTGRKQITRMHTDTLLRWLREQGYKHERIMLCDKWKFRNPTLAKWLKVSKEDRKPGKLFLVVAGNHFQVVMGRKYACGRVHDIVSVRDPRVKRRARVAEVHLVYKD